MKSKLAGNVTFQLIDPKTKDVEKEIKEKNYIVNWMDYIYSLSPRHIDFFQFFYRDCKSMTLEPHCQGLRLYGNALPAEGSGLYSIQLDNNLIGYAADIYSGADTMRGSLNELESGEIVNGYRKVWDFGTGVAVGTINSICLGTANFGLYTDQSGGLEVSKGILGDNLQSVMKNSYTVVPTSAALPSVIVSSIITDHHILLSYQGGTNFNYNDFRIWNRFSHNNINYNTNSYLAPNVYPAGAVSLTLEAIPAGYSRIARPFMDDNYFYILFYLLGTGFKIHKYDNDTGAFIEELTFNFDYVANPTCFFIDGNKILWNGGTTLYWADLSTLTVESLVTGFTYGIVSINKSGIYPDTFLIMSEREAGYADISNAALKTKWFNDVGQVYCNFRSAYLKEPLIIETNWIFRTVGTREYSGGAIYLGVMINTPTTINNLGAPLAKPADKVLKVIYDITWS